MTQAHAFHGIAFPRGLDLGTILSILQTLEAAVVQQWGTEILEDETTALAAITNPIEQAFFLKLTNVANQAVGLGQVALPTTAS